MQGARVSICIPQQYGGATQDDLGGFNVEERDTNTTSTYQTSKRSSVLTRDQGMMRRPSILKKSAEPPRRVSHALLNGGGGGDRHHSIEEHNTSNGGDKDGNGNEKMRPLVTSSIVSVEELLPWLELFHRHAEPVDDKSRADAAVIWVCNCSKQKPAEK